MGQGMVLDMARAMEQGTVLVMEPDTVRTVQDTDQGLEVGMAVDTGVVMDRCITVMARLMEAMAGSTPLI